MSKKLVIILCVFFSIICNAQKEKINSSSKDLVAASVTSTTSSANSKAETTSSTNSKQSNILDFDADVIEGERTGPSILVQMDLQTPNLDTLVYQRKNFNDFHVIDMRRKPKFRGQ